VQNVEYLQLKLVVHSSRGIYQLVRRWVWSTNINLVNEEALAHWGLLLKIKKKIGGTYRSCLAVNCAFNNRNNQYTDPTKTVIVLLSLYLVPWRNWDGKHWLQILFWIKLPMKSEKIYFFSQLLRKVSQIIGSNFWSKGLIDLCRLNRIMKK
jgi:hypothetical protein